MQVIMQSSYITRAPWYVAPNAPKDAHVLAGYGNLRYVLPYILKRRWRSG